MILEGTGRVRDGLVGVWSRVLESVDGLCPATSRSPGAVGFDRPSRGVRRDKETVPDPGSVGVEVEWVQSQLLVDPVGLTLPRRTPLPLAEEDRVYRDREWDSVPLPEPRPGTVARHPTPTPGPRPPSGRRSTEAEASVRVPTLDEAPRNRLGSGGGGSGRRRTGAPPGPHRAPTDVWTFVHRGPSLLAGLGRANTHAH